MIKYIFFLIIPIFVFATEYKVATYNVENLFDTKKSGYEYKEYIPYGKSGWNEKMLKIKIHNISKVIKDINADIIVLQELENSQVAQRLNLSLGIKKYPYVYSNFKSEGIDSVLFSRYPIKDYKVFKIDKKFRPIHQVVIDIEGSYIVIFLNHWPSYKNGNKKRMDYAKALKKLYENKKNYILLGDFNSPLVKNSKNWGQAINYLNKDNINLWFDFPKNSRYSHVFFKDRNALDHIILSKDIYYKFGSFGVYKPKYLLNKYKHPNRWQISKKGRGKHLGIGYSDHFALYATLSTKKLNQEKIQKVSISSLLKTKKNRVNYFLEDVMVIDKNKYGVTIEDKNRDTIYIYKPDFKFEVGMIYSLHVKELSTYKGKKEIVLVDFNSK